MKNAFLRPSLLAFLSFVMYLIKRERINKQTDRQKKKQTNKLTNKRTTLILEIYAHISI